MVDPSMSPVVRKILNSVAEEEQAEFCDPNEREIDSAVLRRICLGLYKQAPLGAKGVRVKGALITGAEAFDLEWADVPVPLQFIDCTFDVPVKMVQARCKSIDFTGSTFKQGFDGDGLRADGDAFFKCVTSTGAIELPGATVSGRVNFSGARITAFANNGTHENPGLAISLANARIGNFVYLGVNKEGSNFRGVVNLSDVQVKGDLLIEGVRIECDSEFEHFLDDTGTLDMPGASITGNIFINSCEIRGGAALTGLQADMLICNATKIEARTGKNKYAIDCGLMKLSGHCELRSEFFGNVNLPYAKIVGALSPCRWRPDAGEKPGQCRAA